MSFSLHSYSLVSQSNCSFYFEQLSDADFSVFSSELSYKRTALFDNARNCLVRSPKKLSLITRINVLKIESSVILKKIERLKKMLLKGITNHIYIDFKNKRCLKLLLSLNRGVAIDSWGCKMWFCPPQPPKVKSFLPKSFLFFLKKDLRYRFRKVTKSHID